jgi:hypothetical protein
MDVIRGSNQVRKNSIKFYPSSKVGVVFKFEFELCRPLVKGFITKVSPNILNSLQKNF